MKNSVLPAVMVLVCVAAVSGYTGSTFREILPGGSFDTEYESADSFEISASIELPPEIDPDSSSARVFRPPQVDCSNAAGGVKVTTSLGR